MSADRARARVFGAVIRPLHAFLRLEASSGILLLLCAVFALLWANLNPQSYRTVFDYPLIVGAGDAVARFTVRSLVNDGLMAIFFFVVGMEIKRELVVGELNTVPKASLPAVAAIGGMLLPAGIFLAFNWGGPGQRGWGIPMATDIAFSIGILTVLKNRIPHALVVFIIALAIFDDIGGILVIAFFYGHGVNVWWLLGAGGLTLTLFAMNRAHVIHGLAYTVVGCMLWYAIHRGGIHAAIAGVVLGLAVPARSQRAAREVLRDLADHVSTLENLTPDDELEGAEILGIEDKLEALQSPVQRFMQLLHPLVAFFIMPLFALANAVVTLRGAGISSLASPVALGTALGLFLGKQLGIFGLTMLAVKLRLAPMPGNASPMNLFGASVIAGIGFTVALFIATLAYSDTAELLDQAKIGILLGSLASGFVGFALLRLTGSPRSPNLTALQSIPVAHKPECCGFRSTPQLALIREVPADTSPHAEV